MGKIYVPPSIKNDAVKIVSNITGRVFPAAVAGALAGKVEKDHHDKIVKELKNKGHARIVKEDHEPAPQGHELLSHT